MRSRRTIIIITILLCIALAGTVFAAWTMVQAFHSFQQQHTLAKQGDVRSIRPWMTIPYIAHYYHVPESYLYQELQVSDERSLHRAPLHAIAAHSHRPVSAVVQNVQSAILTYRKQHSPPSTRISTTVHTSGPSTSRRRGH